MRKAAIVTAMVLSVAGLVFLQTTPPRANLAGMLPGGALLYLEARDFGRLLREWDGSQIKAVWLTSANHEAFVRSNLLQKLQGVYQEYGTAAGLLPDLRTTLGFAGTESALALYEIREVEFLYVSRVGDAQLAQSQLWAMRDKFERRTAGGETFYLRTDPATKRTVAFAFAKGFLFVATRDDLVARALALQAGGTDPSIDGDRWYRDSVTAAPATGELRMVLNLDSIVKSTYFRSYWIQRNVSAIRTYRASIADLTRSTAEAVESRVFLRAGDPAPAPPRSLTDLAALVPAEAGVYRVTPISSTSEAAAMVVQKLFAPSQTSGQENRFAPGAAAMDGHAGTEADLETRIDEPPLPVEASTQIAAEAVRRLLDSGHAEAMLRFQSALTAGATFFTTPGVVVLASPSAWDANAVRAALTAAATPLWTVSGVGTQFIAASAGRHAVEKLDGLGNLHFAVRGPLLFVANSAPLLAATLDRAAATPPAATPLTYAAGFRHGRERANFVRVMRALDFPVDRNAPPFFSGNLASLSRTFAIIDDVSMREEERDGKTLQRVVYQFSKPTK